MALPLANCCSLVLTLLSFRHTLMQHGPVTTLIVALSLLIVFLGSSLIAWKTKKPTTLSRLSVEAELRAMAAVTAEITWLWWLLEDFGVMTSSPTPLSFDSPGAINIARYPVDAS